ncbi:hypothetical protein ABPG74_011217 [Tetrahymena malaccensis]
MSRKVTEFDPPNVIVGKNKSGFFEKATYKTGDVYVDPDQIKRNYEKEKIKKRIHEEPFRTTGFKQIVGCAYEYQQQNKERNLDLRKLRDEDGRVKVGQANIKTGPVNMYFSKIEYKNDDFSRKEMFRKTEYKNNQKKTYLRGLFKNKITIEKPTFSANKEIFGPSEPDPLEVMKKEYLREQFLLNVQNKRNKLKPEELKKRRDIQELDMYTYKIPEYISNGFDTRIFDRMDRLKEKLTSKSLIKKSSAVKK